MNIIIIVLISVIVGGLIVFAYLNPKVKTTVQADRKTEELNIRLRQEVQENNNLIAAQKSAIEENEKTADFWRDFLMKQQTEANIAADNFKKQAFALAEKELEEKLTEIELKKDIAIRDFEKEYAKAREDAISSYMLEIVDKQDQINDLKWEIDYEQSKIDAIVEENKRRAQEENQIDFYRLNLSNEDLEEIQKLRSVLPYLRDKEPLNKVIYKVYYEKPYSDLVGRVVGAGTHTGIYKITNLKNQMCYIGQAANIAERWRQHIKRGVGAEAPTRNKLYPAMIMDGVENFTFEVIEECDRNLLNDREDFWQDFYKAKEFGYSIK